MKAAATFLAALVLLVACDNREISGSQQSLKQTRDDKTFTMTVEIVDAKKIADRCTALGVKYHANGCTAFNLDTKHCTIYVMPQRFSQDEERLTIIGHEVWHCRYGEWHD